MTIDSQPIVLGWFRFFSYIGVVNKYLYLLYGYLLGFIHEADK